MGGGRDATRMSRSRTRPRGKSTPLTKDGTANNGYERGVFWSPDSKKLVALRTEKGDDRKVYLIESSPKDQLQPKLQSYDYLKPGDQVPDLASRTSSTSPPGRRSPSPTRSSPTPRASSEVRWSPDSSRFTFLYNQRGHQVLRLIAVDAATGEATALDR